MLCCVQYMYVKGNRGVLQDYIGIILPFNQNMFNRTYLRNDWLQKISEIIFFGKSACRYKGYMGMGMGRQMDGIWCGWKRGVLGTPSFLF